MSVLDLSARVIATAIERKTLIATAESCTGGMIAGALTDIAGSSAAFDRGFVTYSNEAKNEMLGVPHDLIAAHGAVSGEVAAAMADGALARSNAALAVSVTGVAGPGGGTEEKPVGLVWFGVAQEGRPTKTERRVFPDEGRRAIRANTVEAALEMLLAALQGA
ncbi:MAG: nicotinamide-nucleotide amidohydrolase family protein [Pseudomonadota bacterium]